MTQETLGIWEEATSGTTTVRTYRPPESFRSKLAKFLIRYVFRTRARYHKLPLSGEGFDRSKMVRDIPQSKDGVSVEPFTERVEHTYLFSNGGSKSNSATFFIHGGGFIEGPTPLHSAFAHELCNRTGNDVVLIDYPKAPENSPAVMHKAIADTYLEVVRSYGDGNISVVGDSAGGALALSLAYRLRDDNLPQPNKLVLLSPSLDIRFENTQMRSIETDDPFLDVLVVQNMRDAYLQDGSDPLDPDISPLFGKLQNLPPIHLFMGTHDILMADARLLLDKAKKESASLTYYEFPRMIHVWMLFGFSEAKAARNEIVKILKKDD